MGRKPAEIDKSEFEKLCALQCTKKEICAWFDVTDKTIDAWCRREYSRDYSEIYEEKRGIGKISLRRYQLRLAEKNANMAIWLGKQWLNQRDNPDIEDPDALRRAREILEGIESAIN